MSNGLRAPFYFARNSLLFIVFEFAESLGVSRDAILSEIGLSPALLEGIGTKVPAHMIVDAIECAAAKTGRHDFGLLLGERHDHRIAGTLGLLLEQIETFGEALELTVRYFHLQNNSMQLALVRQASRTLLRVNLLDKGMFEARHYHESMMVARVRFARLFLGPKWTPVSVMFEHQRIASVETYKKFFGPHVRFEQPTTAIAFAAADLSARSKSPDPEVKRRLEAILQAVEAHEFADLTFKVSQVVRKLLPMHLASIEEVAKAMAMSPRTLQRRLEADDLSFKGILADVRFDMAREHLGGGALTATQVAQLLGFSESSSLSRFLRDHAGVSASELRSRAKRPPEKFSGRAPAARRARRR